jgi:hypothetical protein
LLGEWRDVGIVDKSLRSYLEHDAPSTLFSPDGYPKFIRLLELREETLLARYRKSNRTLSHVINELLSKKRKAISKRRG